MEKLRRYFESHAFKTTAAVFLILAGVLLIFQTGVSIGYKNAFYSCRLGDNYYKNFEGENNMGTLPGFDPTRNLPSAHGSAGSISRIELPDIVVADQDGVEKTVTVSSDTVIRKFRDTIQASDLTVGETIVVVGDPDQNGDIDAKLIRVLPAPSTNATSTQP